MSSASTDRRYTTRKWKQLRLMVLRRDLWRCMVVLDCPMPGNVCDHIRPTYAGMPDSEFYDPRNLRAACHRHNVMRGSVERLQKELDGKVGPPRRRSRFMYAG